MFHSSFYLFGICILYSCHPSRSLFLGSHRPLVELPYFIVNIENPFFPFAVSFFYSIFFYSSLPSPVYQTFENKARAVTRFFLSSSPFVYFFWWAFLSILLFNKNRSEHKRMVTDRKVRSMVYTVETSFFSVFPLSPTLFFVFAIGGYLLFLREVYQVACCTVQSFSFTQSAVI